MSAPVTSSQRGRQILTHSGRLVNPVHLQAADVCLEDIAYALAGLNRFTGHASQRYTVAEHSVMVARALKATGKASWTCYAGLLHDASEAYMNDLSSPLKHTPELRGYRDLERRNQRVIEEALGLHVTAQERAFINAADLYLLEVELWQLMPPHPDVPLADFAASARPLACWSPEAAEMHFLLAAQEHCSPRRPADAAEEVVA